ncbi:DUF2877 domain-containing protein [Bradyrhizobium sp. NP1]|uniref:DUF2877 domain-containing protein n=1 Tax=Bradyrhizobium sp. NP1 TaxID=3049772 RepID=UPI0025A5EFDA|nr:DUF2877 domain-containing protein [Bradyrhizobium sp. NP1]WJR80355.1 DUF2877 domain-containing protein [Bradyrhizobium sp. NP1]
MDERREIDVMWPADSQLRVPGAGTSERLGGGVVIEAGVLAHRALRGGCRGRIAAVFERSLYAALDDCWICIGSAELGSGPLHLLCRGIEPRRFEAGQEVAVADRTILVDGLPLAGFEAASVWAPPPSPDWTRESLRAGLAAVDQIWCLLPTDQGLAASGGATSPARPSRVLVAALPGLATLRRLIEAGLCGHRSSPHRYRQIVELIGLGPGLTPSGDDLIGGALVALASIGRLATRDALWRACRSHLARTNEISAAHLRSAALGYAAAALHEAIDATIGGQAGRVKPALAALSGIGHSSGLDAFAGVLMVLRAAEYRLFCDGARRHSALAGRDPQQRFAAGV